MPVVSLWPLQLAPFPLPATVSHSAPYSVRGRLPASGPAVVTQRPLRGGLGVPDRSEDFLHCLGVFLLCDEDLANQRHHRSTSGAWPPTGSSASAASEFHSILATSFGA